MTVTSSDGRVQVDLHAAYASALVYVDLTAAGAPSAITILRNGVEIVTQRNTGGTAVWYDHFPEYGANSYTASAAGGVTTTAAAVTVSEPADGRTWLKSTDPNTSLLVRQATLEPVSYAKARGVFRGPLASAPVIVEEALGKRSWSLRVIVPQQDRAKLLSLCDSRGAILYAPPSVLHDDRAWLSLGGPTWDRSAARSIAGVFPFTIPADEVAPPVLDSTNIVIPGWGWDQVVATYGTWDAAVAAKGSWIALLRQGVGA